MFILLLASLVAVGYAQPPVWWAGGQCGVSQYADAGDMNLPPGKIVGGIEARPYEFPWQVSVQRKSSGSHFCGASIINANWIVCAAHCMSGETPGIVSVSVGDHDRGAVSAVRVVHDVAAIFVHELYNSRTFENDVSLIKTVNPIDLSTANVKPICAPDPANDYVYYKSQCSGWGTINSGGICCPDVLRYVTLNITTNAFCDAVYTTDTIYPDMICATDNTGMNERDSCQGDSGGPLSTKSAGGIFSLIGIVSWGIGCASGFPGVYCRVGSHTAWITDKITNN